jgi:alkylation response protein AidB-like acyl-CoA dehydrogenase
MQLNLSEDQELFRETTKRFIESELPLSATRALHDDPVGYDPAWLRRGAELGWFSMLVPESYGGGSVSGRGVPDAAIIAEQLGAQVQPGPFIPMNVVAAALAEQGADRTELLGELVSATAIATWAPFDETGAWDLGAGLRARRTETGYLLTGVRGFVQDVVSADWLLVAADLDGTPTQFLVPRSAEGVSHRPLSSLDLSRRFAHVSFADVAVGSDAVVAAGTESLGRQLDVALALLCAETVGAMDALFTMTVEYSKDRIAFGRPIGSFQALKHLMADQALNLESCKAGAVAALDAVERRSASAAEVASMTAAFVGDLGNELAQECLQIHGGIGYTWEHDLHLLMRRIQTNSALYGTPTWHRERVCTFYELGVGV